jgi:hypothetical protein
VCVCVFLYNLHVSNNINGLVVLKVDECMQCVGWQTMGCRIGAGGVVRHHWSMSRRSAVGPLSEYGAGCSAWCALGSGREPSCAVANRAVN